MQAVIDLSEKHSNSSQLQEMFSAYRDKAKFSRPITYLLKIFYNFFIKKKKK